MMKASTSSLRSKLWSSGYKLSSNKVDEFLQYLVDNNMILSEESEEEEEDSIPIKQCHQVNNLEHIVTIMEQEVQRLEAQVQEFTGSSWADNDIGLFEPECIDDEREDIIDNAPSPEAEKVTVSRSHARRVHKSDPVQMFHQMQAIWSKHNTKRHCP
jgi:hypothetical protein